MSDLISREALYEKTCEWEAQALHMCEVTMNDEDKTEWRRWSAILKERSAFKFDVADAPTIDAVPVVRCKNCECWYPEEDDEYGHCRKHDFWTSGNWYCADSERREDGKK